MTRHTGINSKYIDILHVFVHRLEESIESPSIEQNCQTFSRPFLGLNCSQPTFTRHMTTYIHCGSTCESKADEQILIHPSASKRSNFVPIDVIAQRFVVVRLHDVFDKVKRSQHKGEGGRTLCVSGIRTSTRLQVCRFGRRIDLLCSTRGGCTWHRCS